MSETSHSSRLEAFCDGVFAIALTLLIIDIKISSTTEIKSDAEFWQALKHIAPSIFAFLLSFIIIFITWVNHHNALRMTNRSSNAFIYANGLLLLTVVFIPFPTSLVGEYILTDHAAPAVILYNSTMAFQAIGWIVATQVSLKQKLIKEKSINQAIQSRNYGFVAFALYSGLAIIAIWFPFTIAIITTLTWIIWLIWGIQLKHE